MKKIKVSYVIFALLAISFGIFMVVFGERDDSPGAQLLGVLLFVGGIVCAVKSRKKISEPGA